MDDAGPRIGGQRRIAQFGITPEQGIDYRAVVIAGRGMHHHPGGLVDHHHGLVLIENGKGKRFRSRRFRRGRFRQFQRQRHARLQRRFGGCDRHAIHRQSAGTNQFLEIGPRMVRQFLRQRHIQPPAGFFGRDREFEFHAAGAFRSEK
ncbi:hypothetical protein SDC9_201338 [bioreactor metagenome]|uniref:Uncharacterized protein n=1 Tax=bioreactor metagenome TaxID=1076179 RepID=A0A645IZK1_9ZZZZ